MLADRRLWSIFNASSLAHCKAGERVLDDFTAQHDHHVARKRKCFCLFFFFFFLNAIGRDPKKQKDLKWLSTREDDQLIAKILNDAEAMVHKNSNLIPYIRKRTKFLILC